MSNILIFHGFAASPPSLQRAVDMLIDAGHQVTAPVMSSFSFDSGKYSLPEQWLKEAEQVLVEYGATVEDFYLAGHSLGGAVCAHLLSGNLGRRFASRVPKCAFLATPAGIDKEFVTFWIQESSRHIDWPFDLRVQMLSFLHRTDSKFAQVKVPSLVIQGGGDKHIPPSACTALCNRLGKYCLACMSHPEADHFFPEKNGAGPDALLKHMVSFFASSS